MQPPAKRKRFDLQARMAAMQSTQKKYSELRAAAPEATAVPGRVPQSRLNQARGQVEQCLRDMRSLAAEYHGVDGGSVEIEVRLGRFLSKQTGQRFDYGKGLFALPSSVGTVTDMSFDAGVEQEHFDRIQATLNRASTMGKMRCEPTEEEIYIYETAERTVSNRLYVDSASQTPIMMQRKEALRDVDGCIFMPTPLSVRCANYFVPSAA